MAPPQLTLAPGVQCEKMKVSLQELDRLLAERPELPTADSHEERSHRMRRWLREENLDAAAACDRLCKTDVWWNDSGMESFTELDELDETGPLFVCGQDHWGRPVLVARPCTHMASSKSDSIRAAKRCVYTVKRCIEHMPHEWEEQKAIVIYDCSGLRRQNLDLTFVQEVVATLTKHFPDRLERVLVINGHWTMNFFWYAIKRLLHPEVVEKVIMCGEDFRDALSDFVPADHPYLCYALAIARDEKGMPLPRRSEFRANREEEKDEDLETVFARDTTADTLTPEDPSPQLTSSEGLQTPISSNTFIMAEDEDVTVQGRGEGIHRRCINAPPCNLQVKQEHSWWTIMACSCNAEPRSLRPTLIQL
eukprot:TRINITY_DN94797_c0_g1_i1.p1 TRINITY_DN94797_c0_g1~~TRINITY_DN94797_c0_g1_i1.p1  ORF type:complete len:364 (-),score=79.35 TRINITY_DN94797_c0_g1_i1:26-1117(-)